MPQRTLVMPDLGMEGRPVTAGQWLAERGGRVRAGEPLLEVLAGVAVVDLPAPADGLLVEILVDEDAPLHAGQRLAVIEEEGPGNPSG